MVWFQIDDSMWSHPKMIGLTPEAGWLWVRSGAYCAQHLTDGCIKQGALTILGATTTAIAELVDAGLWLPVPGGYLFHDWSHYQRTRDQVRTARDATRERQAKWRAEREARNAGEDGVTNGVTNSVSNSVSNGVSNGVTNGVTNTALTEPSRAEPTHQKREGARKRATPPPDLFPITDDMRGWAATNTPGINLDDQTARFLDWARANGKTYKDWHAAWRNWMKKARDWQPAADKPTPVPPPFRPPETTGTTMPADIAEQIRTNLRRNA